MFKYLVKLPEFNELIDKYPMGEKIKQIKAERDMEIKEIAEGKKDKFLLIIGPCSAHNEDAIVEYVTRLSKIQEIVKDKMIIIPRIYTNKPRTTGEGYKGLFHQPDPHAPPDIIAGLVALRKMHLRCLENSGLSAADEMLYPDNHTYLDDLLSYVAVGARSVENQQHRLAASGLDIPVGMKNPTSGDLSVMLNSVYAAQHSHVFSYQGWEVKTSGNPYTHAVLRGAVNKHGESIPNYHYEDLINLTNMYQKMELKNPMIIIDTNHANSNKNFKEQPRIVNEVLNSRKYNPDIKKFVKGFLIESNLVEGSQPVTGDTFGQSITDPCLGWDDSEKLILSIADRC